MKNKFFIFLGICAAIFGGGIIMLLSSGDSKQKIDAASVNDVAMTYAESKALNDTFEKAEKYGFSVTILDKMENIIGVHGNAARDKASAIADRETMLTLSDGETIIISDDFSTFFTRYRNRLIVLFCVCFGLIVVMVSLFSLFILLRVVKPFEKLRIFAGRVAQGNLDYPLEMDRENLFGAFTESFDLMRVELAASKEREQAAEQSKKELIASLSHDIKTPVASIRATAELVEVMADDERIRDKATGIEHKADQIELLIDNLFHATLEELQELSVTNSEENSQIISELIGLADFSGLVREFNVPQCIISCDRLRLGQVFDNIISNSYKYAGTPINVKCEIENSFMKIEIADEGKGLDEDDISRCCDKFYRGKNCGGKNGSGLGLYISSYFCEKMGGSLEVTGRDGFCVTVTIPLAK